MVFKSKIKWVALFVLALSMGSLLVHLSITKFSAAGLVQYSPLAALRQDFGSLIGTQVSFSSSFFYIYVDFVYVNTVLPLCVRGCMHDMVN